MTGVAIKIKRDGEPGVRWSEELRKAVAGVEDKTEGDGRSKVCIDTGMPGHAGNPYLRSPAIVGVWPVRPLDQKSGE